MSSKKTIRLYVLKHVKTGLWLEHWIDGWYLTEKINEATHFDEKPSGAAELVTTMTKLFGGDRIEIFFPEESQPTSVNALQPAMG